MHFIYQINRLTTTKVDSIYLGWLANNAQRIIMSRCRARTHDHRIDSQAPCTIAPFQWLLNYSQCMLYGPRWHSSYTISETTLCASLYIYISFRFTERNTNLISSQINVHVITELMWCYYVSLSKIIRVSSTIGYVSILMWGNRLERSTNVLVQVPRMRNTFFATGLPK